LVSYRSFNWFVFSNGRVVWAEQFRAAAGVILPLKKDEPSVTIWLYWLFGFAKLNENGGAK